jgi:hypothetical protein
MFMAFPSFLVDTTDEVAPYRHPITEESGKLEDYVK